MRNLTYDYISGHFFRRIEGNIRSSNPESRVPSISPYIKKLIVLPVPASPEEADPKGSVSFQIKRGVIQLRVWTK